MYNPNHLDQVRKQYPIGSTIDDAWRWEGEQLTVTGYIISEDFTDNSASIEIRTKTKEGHEVVLELSQLPQ